MTHDAKRSLDTRTRIAVLSQLPDRWTSVSRDWLQSSEAHCSEVGGRFAPDLQERYFILQTLVGVWPIEPERLDGYLEKALREAKRNSNWVEPHAEYEQAVMRYAHALTADDRFRAELDGFLQEVERARCVRRSGSSC